MLTFFMVLMTFIALLFIIIPLIKGKIIKTTLCGAMLFSFFSVSLYYYWGNASGLHHYILQQQQEAKAKLALTKIKNPQQVVEQLLTYLNDHPNSSQGWYLLGKLYLNVKDYAKAVPALLKAHQQNPNNIVYTTAYAESLFFFHQRQLNPEAKHLLQEVLQRDTNNVAANNLLAMDAYNIGQYQQAIYYWEKLIPLFDEHGKDEQVLLKMIGNAQKKLMIH